MFEYVWANKLLPNLEDPNKLYWTDLNLLLNSYEYWKFESNMWYAVSKLQNVLRKLVSMDAKNVPKKKTVVDST